MKIKNKLLLVLPILSLFIPVPIKAYSNKVILGGENIGIEIESSGIIIVGFYEINNKNINLSNNIKLGDKIIKINDKNVNNIEEMINQIKISLNKNEIPITIERNNKEIKTKLQVIKDKNGIYKTGLYVKDTISGIGTLTYIDPETKIYGALGHEVIESYSKSKVNVKNGTIFESTITDINKTNKNKTGEKEASLNKSNIYGNIKENTENGIFGNYYLNREKNNLIEVAKNNEIHEGKAYIYTVLEENKKEKYEINIIKIDSNSKTKNILFEITDKNLIDKTGGVIKGMSGSPIIQDNKLIGAITHAIQNKNNMGYGIFITTMLEEGEN
ncbi:MAG: stage IV sporulation protein B [Bacilli bacterium]|nr:stage IV sporulation protein B [Bacilli bacterium]